MVNSWGPGTGRFPNGDLACYDRLNWQSNMIYSIETRRAVDYAIEHVKNWYLMGNSIFEVSSSILEGGINCEVWNKKPVLPVDNPIRKNLKFAVFEFSSEVIKKFEGAEELTRKRKSNCVELEDLKAVLQER